MSHTMTQKASRMTRAADSSTRYTSARGNMLSVASAAVSDDTYIIGNIETQVANKARTALNGLQQLAEPQQMKEDSDDRSMTRCSSMSHSELIHTMSSISNAEKLPTTDAAK